MQYDTEHRLIASYTHPCKKRASRGLPENLAKMKVKFWVRLHVT